MPTNPSSPAPGDRKNLSNPGTPHDDNVNALGATGNCTSPSAGALAQQNTALFERYGDKYSILFCESRIGEEY
jgi:hypothetical protein